MTTSTNALPRAPFQGVAEYSPATTDGYELLPFRFLRLNDGRYVATNLVGQHVVLDRERLERLICHELPSDDPLFETLQARHFLMPSGPRRSDVGLDLLAAQYRSKHAGLADFTALHIFVVTLRCDTACKYCQVSRVSEHRDRYDMPPAVADRAVDLAFRSPSPRIKIEFQGGEPLLNFPLIQRIVERSRHINAGRKAIDFVVATNLSLVTRDMLEYLRSRGVHVSTSVDGPEDLHNANRPRAAGNSYAKTIEGIRLCRQVLGPRSVSALMTTTKATLARPEDVVDEYVHQGFASVFLRPLSPFGFAAKAQTLSYSECEWNAFYERGLRHILALNQSGVPFREEYAAIILRRLLTPLATGYVDLQSPAALGIGVAVYNYDGDVYMSDEARMLAEMDDKTFRLGNILEDSYEDMFHGDRLRSLLLETMTEATPQCATCAFQPICGSEPIFHHATQGDVIGHRPTSAFCSRQMATMKLLVQLLEDDPASREILERWAY